MVKQHISQPKKVTFFIYRRGLLEERLKEKKSRLGEVEEGIKKFVPDVALADASANNGYGVFGVDIWFIRATY